MAFTYFFRDKQTLDFIQGHILPELRQRRFINIWDAGCAMGPEPYSLAIVLRENMSRFLFRNVRIYATDIDNSDLFGPIIRDGLYLPEQLRSVPPVVLQNYFQPEGQGFKVNEEIRNSIVYMKHDLLSLAPVRTGFSLIICKNVLLHFNEKQRIDVLRMFHESLDENGFLAMEQTQKLPEETKALFSPVSQNTQVFRKRCVRQSCSEPLP